jgi:hypothetical protein
MLLNDPIKMPDCKYQITIINYLGVALIQVKNIQSIANKGYDKTLCDSCVEVDGEKYERVTENE